MSTPSRSEIIDVLRSTLADGELSRREAQAFRRVIEMHRDDRETLARFRNAAFDTAAEVVSENAGDMEIATEMMRWLGKVDKIIDNINLKRDTAAASRSEISVAFTPGGDGLDLIRSRLKAARQTLDICVFTITDDRITAAIIEAHRRGVAVRIVTDNEKRFDRGSDIHRLREAGLAVRFDPAEDHMHHKFAIIDGGESYGSLLIGSYNWTRGATRNHESLIELPSGQGACIKRFVEEFERLWQAFSRG